jgi:hypothetical protein
MCLEFELLLIHLTKIWLLGKILPASFFPAIMWMSPAWLARFDELFWWAQYEDLEDDKWLS